MNLQDLYCQDADRACKLALEQTSELKHEQRLEKINELLGGFGVEAIRGNRQQDGYWCDIVADYVNMGETYKATVLCVRGETSWHDPSWHVASWGDWVEQNGERYGVI